MTKLIIFKDKIGKVKRIGLYENNKWVKWVRKKDIELWKTEVDKIWEVIQ